MRISEHWLREWVDPPVSTAELAEQLTMAGLEVDGIEPAAAEFTGVVVGRVLALTPHPDAERLQIARVSVGQREALQIVCGAPNVRVDMLAPTALAGARLPGGAHIASAERRGVLSQGMLCSARELGLGEDGEGLLELPADSAPGQDMRRLLGLDDRIIELDLTPNRGDCLAIAGIAREVGGLNRCEVRAAGTEPVEPVVDAVFPITVSAPADCPRYGGRVIRGVDPQAPTPLWMRERLRRSGLRPLGPLVDVTNYVMLELGQPMHAFDLARLAGGIEVRRAHSGETLELLNGSRVELDPEVLVIADQSQALALAGIMGGAASAVDGTTRDVLLESAFFTPTVIAGRPRRFGLSTDASHRFERGVDPQLQVPALERATRLLLAIAGGQPGPVIEAVAPAQLPAQPAIRLRRERIRRLLGMEIDAQKVSGILLRLGMAVADEGDHWLVVPPAFRFDIALEADLIEEIGRIYGYGRVPSRRPLASLAVAPRPETRLSLSRVREALVQRGYQEAITYSFVDPTLQQALDPERRPLALANPISADLAVMRTTLWPGLVGALGYNRNRQQSRVRLFETGLTFVQEGAGLIQALQLGAAVCGEALPEQWGIAKRMVDFFDLKGDLEALLALTGEPRAFSFTPAEHPALHPGRTARIIRHGEPIGWLGALHPTLEQRLDLGTRIYVFELSFAGIGTARLPQFAELSKFPASRRDLAVVVDEGVCARALEEGIRAHGSTLLQDVRLFDVYRGEGIPEGRKSIAFGLILQDFSRNLTDLAVDEIVAQIVAGLEQRFGATLRV